MRNRAGLMVPGVASLAVGAILMAIPVVLVLTGRILDLVWTVLLWVGFGEIVLGAALLVFLTMARAPEESAADVPDAYGDDDRGVAAPMVTPSE